MCKAPCHVDECPDCDLNTDVKCRCGNMDREIACKDLTSKADDARCEKRCKKKRSCGKHNCNQLCCIDIEHICPLPCSKTLSCGRHKCQERCHIGECAFYLQSYIHARYQIAERKTNFSFHQQGDVRLVGRVASKSCTASVVLR